MALRLKPASGFVHCESEPYFIPQHFGQWGIGHIALDARLDTLSGGEKTKVFLAGIIS